MAQVKTFKCDFPRCDFEQTEPETGAGVQGGWSGLVGVILNGEAQPMFCPSCTKRIMFFIDPENVVEV